MTKPSIHALKEAIEGVLKCQKENGHPESYLIGLGRIYNRLLGLTGTRMFRHNVASSMLRKGVPLPVISEELGHKSQDSTMVYLSTDRETMSSLTLPLPKGGGKA